jgi:hypothetical protein
MLTKTDLGYSESFASVAEFISIDAAAKRGGSDKAWTFGTSNESETREMLLSGQCTDAALEAAAASKDRALAALAPTMGATKRRRAVWSDSGDEWDSDRVNANHEYPARDIRVGRQAPIVRLGVNFTLSCGNSEQAFARAIGAAAGVADCLTVAGYSVEIVGMFACTGMSSKKQFDDKPCVYTFPVKCSDETLDVARVCSLALTGLSRFWGAARILSDTQGHNWGCLDHSAYKALAGVDAMVSQSWYGNEQRYVEDLLGGLNEPAPEPEPEPEYAPAPKPEPAPAASDDEPEYVPEPHRKPEHKPSPNEGPTVRRGTGPRGDGMEVGFTNKPAQSTIDALKALGFRWSPRGKVWWAKDSQARYENIRQFF